PHVQVRSQIGPHRLDYSADFELVPESPSDQSPKVGEPIELAMTVHDELSLVWASTDEHAQRFSIRQLNDREDRRELVVAGQLAYTRLREANWYQRLLDGDVHELWLDDAQRSVHDLFEFMAPRAAVKFLGENETEGVRTLRYGLTLADAVDTALGRDGDESLWRAAAEIRSLSGELSL